MRRRLLLGVPLLVLVALVVPSFLVVSERADETLYVISPHWEGIKYEFERGFREWYRKRTEEPDKPGKIAKIQWVDIGGSGRIRRYLDSEVKRAGAAGTVDIDVIFGGGDFMHRQLASAGVLERVNLPRDIADDLPAEFAGIQLRDPDGLWLGAALSTFGIITNKAILTRKGLPEPREWADLTDTPLYSWVAAADLQSSGTAHTMYELILQAYGWDKGSAILTQMMANARYITQASSDVPEDIARGDVAYGLAIDFYAQRQVALHGAHRIGYVVPERLTVVNADPIAKVKRCANDKLADAFITFVLSCEGQKLWCYRRGTEGGPEKFELGRLPVRRALYASPSDVATFAFNPFTWNPGFNYNGKSAGQRYDALDWYLGAAFVANHERLTAAWKAVIDAGRPKDLVDLLCRPTLSEEELTNVAKSRDFEQAKYARHAEWVRQFRDQYDRVRSLARERVR